MGPFCIYALVASGDEGTVRYVGKTIFDHLDRRVKQHVNQVNRRHTPKNSWIKSVIARGATICPMIIELCDSDNWEERERFWIAHYRQIAPLTNVSDGGDTGPNMTGHRHTDEVKAIIAKHSTGRKRSLEFIEKFKQSRAGWKPSPEVVERIRKTRLEMFAKGDLSWQKGVQAAIAANKGKKYSPERIERAAAPQRGKRRCAASLMASRKAVICVETGTWFSSIAEATKRCGYVTSALGQAIKRGGKCGGYHWKLSQQKEIECLQRYL